MDAHTARLHSHLGVLTVSISQAGMREFGLLHRPAWASTSMDSCHACRSWTPLHCRNSTGHSGQGAYPVAAMNYGAVLRAMVCTTIARLSSPFSLLSRMFPAAMLPRSSMALISVNIDPPARAMARDEARSGPIMAGECFTPTAMGRYVLLPPFFLLYRDIFRFRWPRFFEIRGMGRDNGHRTKRVARGPHTGNLDASVLQVVVLRGKWP
ncbi:hypothetical protein C8T65DRAFT_273271 [Cerioporus squamosus]|nr:hypothetical protein C8T65DRAFT_273271 [Cerioporus squamosus]